MADATPDRLDMVTLGMFMIDEFAWTDEGGIPTGKQIDPQIGGGGTYATIGARIWLPPTKVACVVDRGHDFPDHIQSALDAFGPLWFFRDHADRITTRSRNTYRGDERIFEYLTPRIRVTPRDLLNTRLERPNSLHLICAPNRAASVINEVDEVDGWEPSIIYEPVEYACVAEELPALIPVLPRISILSPNAAEALRLLSIPHDEATLTRALIETAAHRFLDLGVGAQNRARGSGYVIIRAAGLGAYVVARRHGAAHAGRWVEAYWREEDGRVIDVTGAGNSFLGGLAAGLNLANGDVYKATFYATVSASYVIEQQGLPRLECGPRDERELWNGDDPHERLKRLLSRHGL